MEWRLKYPTFANVTLVTVALILAGSAFYRTWIRPPYASGGNLQVGQLALVDKSGRTRALLLIWNDLSSVLLTFSFLLFWSRAGGGRSGHIDG